MFSCDFAKFLRTPILKNICERFAGGKSTFSYESESYFANIFPDFSIIFPDYKFLYIFKILGQLFSRLDSY